MKKMIVIAALIGGMLMPAQIMAQRNNRNEKPRVENRDNRKDMKPGNGKGGKLHGATADDLVILVPPGTLIRDEESGKIIHDMTEDDGADFVCCKGGRGGALRTLGRDRPSLL